MRDVSNSRKFNCQGHVDVVKFASLLRELERLGHKVPNVSSAIRILVDLFLLTLEENPLFVSFDNVETAQNYLVLSGYNINKLTNSIKEEVKQLRTTFRPTTQSSIANLSIEEMRSLEDEMEDKGLQIKRVTVRVSPKKETPTPSSDEELVQAMIANKPLVEEEGETK
jgi:hypothetical protein